MSLTFSQYQKTKTYHDRISKEIWSLDSVTTFRTNFCRSWLLDTAYISIYNGETMILVYPLLIMCVREHLRNPYSSPITFNLGVCVRTHATQRLWLPGTHFFSETLYYWKTYTVYKNIQLLIMVFKVQSYNSLLSPFLIQCLLFLSLLS